MSDPAACERMAQAAHRRLRPHRHPRQQRRDLDLAGPDAVRGAVGRGVEAGVRRQCARHVPRHPCGQPRTCAPPSTGGSSTWPPAPRSRACPFFLHYVASKGAVLAMTEALAKELGGDNILVNTVAPGFTMSDGVLANPTQVQPLQEVSAKARVLARDQFPEDIVGAVLSSPARSASFITGQSLVVDGGAYFNYRGTAGRRASRAPTARHGRAAGRARAGASITSIDDAALEHSTRGAVHASERPRARAVVRACAHAPSADAMLSAPIESTRVSERLDPLRPCRLPARRRRLPARPPGTRASASCCTARSASTPQGRLAHYGPLEAWFEPGPEPVFAAASETEPTAFVRCMVLPGRAAREALDPLRARRGRRQAQAAGVHGLRRRAARVTAVARSERRGGRLLADQLVVHGLRAGVLRPRRELPAAAGRPLRPPGHGCAWSPAATRPRPPTPPRRAAS